MFALLIDAHRNSQNALQSQPTHNAAKSPSVLVSAIAVVSQAEEQYGKEVKDWTTRKLKKVVIAGTKGIYPKVEKYYPHYSTSLKITRL